MRTKAMDITGRKRFLALLLVFAFLCSFLLVRANAEEDPEDGTTEEVTEEVVKESAEEESSCCGEGCSMSCCVEDSTEACSCSAGVEELTEAEDEISETDETASVSEELSETDSETETVAYSGYIGDSTITWRLSGGVLWIGGSGTAPVFSSADDQPWAAVADEIEQVYFEDDISVPDLAYWFTNCANLYCVEIPSFVECIGTDAFAGTSSLTQVLIYHTSDDELTIADGAFRVSSLDTDSVMTLYVVDFTLSAVLNYDWLSDNRQVEMADVYGVSSASIYCMGCSCMNGNGHSACDNTDYDACYCTDSDDDDDYDSYETYTVTFSLTNLKKKSGSTTATEGSSYTAYLTASTGYSLPSSITVKVGSKTLSTSYYTWSSSTGKIKISASKVTGNITITASGTANSYTITWDYNDGSGDSTTTSQTYGSSLSLPTTPTRSGYTFDGWYTSSSGGTQVTSSTTYSTADATTYYAHWTQTSYSITYLDAGGEAFSGTLPDDAATEHTYGTETELPTPTRDGYSFNGWYLDENCTELVTVLDDTNCSSDITLYASWSLIMSVTVPATLVLVMDENGTVYAATSAEITNNSYAAVEITSLTVVAAGDWTVVSYNYDMAGAKVDSNLIGISVNGCKTTQTASSERLSLSGDWAVDALSSLPLTYDAVISALSEAVTGESVLSLVCVVNWAA